MTATTSGTARLSTLAASNMATRALQAQKAAAFNWGRLPPALTGWKLNDTRLTVGIRDCNANSEYNGMAIPCQRIAIRSFVRFQLSLLRKPPAEDPSRRRDSIQDFPFLVDPVLRSAVDCSVEYRVRFWRDNGDATE